MDPAELRTRLRAAGVDVDGWRRPATRSVEDLTREIARGECRLLEDPLVRQLRVVRLDVRRGDLILHELYLDEGDGRRLERDRPPAEKLMGDESAEVGALRCAAEELGLARAEIELHAAAFSHTDHLASNPGYPGLATDYEVHVARITAPTLPDGEFETVEREQGPGGRVVTHGWGWRTPKV